MPQISRQGQLVFGWSTLGGDLSLTLPAAVVTAYDIACEGRVYLFAGRAPSGGFTVTRRGLLLRSRVGNILWDKPALDQYKASAGMLLPVRGRKICWLPITERGELQLTLELIRALNLAPGQRLLALRVSAVAFGMAAHGPLVEQALINPVGIPR